MFRISRFGLVQRISARLSHVAAILLLTASSAVGHPISLSEVVLDVKPSSVRAELRVMLEDLVLYYGIAADGNLKLSADKLKSASQRHKEFLQKYFHLRDTTGRRLTGKFTGLDEQAISDGDVLQADLMRRSLAYHIEFPLQQQPDYLTVSQNFGGQNAPLPAVMDCTILQNGVLLETSIQLTPDQPHSTRFDWNNPPQPGRITWRELKARKQRERQRRLGITSYSRPYSYLYLTDREVRHEILIPVLTLERFVALPRREPDFLEIDEQHRARDIVESFLRDRNPVTVDGRRIRPVLSRLQFFGLDINDFARNAKPRRVSVHQARVGLILSYPVTSPPQSVDLVWDTLNENAPQLQSIVLINDESPHDFVFTQKQTRFRWTAKADATSRRKSRAPFAVDKSDSQVGRLLSRVYRSLELPGESEVYDSLSRAVSSELLPSLYLQVRRSLTVTEQGGAIARVRDVQLVSQRTLDNSTADRPRFECRWRVIGTIEHWGHIHTRENEYVAILAIAGGGADAKIASYELQQQKPVRVQIGLRSGIGGD